MLYKKIEKTLSLILVVFMMTVFQSFAQSSKMAKNDSQFKLTAANKNNIVQLTWNNNSSQTITVFNVYRFPVEKNSSTMNVDPTKLNFTKVASTKDKRYDDHLSKKDSESGEYYYYVVGVNGKGEKIAVSNYVKVSTK